MKKVKQHIKKSLIWIGSYLILMASPQGFLPGILPRDTIINYMLVDFCNNYLKNYFNDNLMTIYNWFTLYVLHFIEL